MGKLDYNNLEIDIMKLYTAGNTDKWNYFLTDCLNKRDINRLMLTRIGLQKGIDTLAKKKLNSEKVCEAYLRWCRSLEITAKKIIKELNPMPTDNPHNTEFKTVAWIEAKRRRDHEFEKFILRSSY